MQLFGCDSPFVEEGIGNGRFRSLSGSGVITVLVRFPSGSVTCENEDVVLRRHVFGYVLQHRGHIRRIIHRSIRMIHDPFVGQGEVLNGFLVLEIDAIRSHFIEIHLAGFATRYKRLAFLFGHFLTLLVQTFLRRVFHIHGAPNGEVFFLRREELGSTCYIPLLGVFQVLTAVRINENGVLGLFGRIGRTGRLVVALLTSIHAEQQYHHRHDKHKCSFHVFNNPMSFVKK